jgi:SpoVK/Ycf46/Vps4 family AAA+-type ATPase
MMHPHSDWTIENQRSLLAAVADVRERIEAATSRDSVIHVATPPDGLLQPPPAFERLRSGLGLTRFELDVALLCAGIELDDTLAELINAMNGGGGVRPTVGLTLRILRDAHWSAFTPAAPLRRWRIIEIDSAATLATSPVRLDERTLHFLLGNDYLEPRIAGLLQRVELGLLLPDSYRELAEEIASRWGSGEGLLCLDGEDRAAFRTIGAVGCARLGMSVHGTTASAIAGYGGERETLARLWEREAIFLQSALLIEDDSAGDGTTVAATHDFVNRLQGPVIVPPSLAPRGGSRPVVYIRIDELSPAEQRALWLRRMGSSRSQLNGRVDELIAQFPMSAEQIASTLEQAERERDHAELIEDTLWDACRAQMRSPMGRLAQRIETRARWDDLVLPHDQLTQLHEIVSQTRYRARVHDTWDFGHQSRRGVGITALFEGPSGTGKTLAAEVLANALRLDLYRIDLSQIVSKYIGESEKNLSVVFDAAERGGAILLFDEADSLFGKRSEVKDSHDRYANIEVSYLLQRMESYRGLAILTTNQRTNLDQAFLRRLRFVITFPFPDATQRAAIWQHVFPDATPTCRLDYEQLSRLNVTGGIIRNIALRAAFLAAAEERPIGMTQLRQAARGECLKLEKRVVEAEIGGWV